MFNFFKKENISKTLYILQGKIDEHSKLIKDIQEELARVDIKAMEGMKRYGAKLRRLTSIDETETNKSASVFLNPDGNIL